MNGRSFLTRRQWIGSGLATCGYLGGAFVPSQCQAASARVPGLQARVISDNLHGEKSYAVIFAKGDEILSGLTEFVDREKLTSGYFTAIGALQSAQFGWFDRARKAYRDIPINEQVELISLLGDVSSTCS